MWLRTKGYSGAEISAIIKPKNIVFTPGEFEKNIRKAGLGSIILWDDVGYWMHPRVPRQSGFSEFWDGVDNSVN
jgi:hypothetical protein